MTGHPAYRVRIVSDPTEFAALRQAWNDLVSRAAEANTFKTWEWLNSWWEAYRPACALKLILVERSDRIVGIAPLMIGRESRYGVPFKALRFVGDGTYETDHIGFILDKDEADSAVPLLMTAVEGLEWDIAFLSQVPDDSATAACLREWVRSMNYSGRENRVPCAARALPADYNGLLASLPARFRTALRSTRKRLAEGFAADFGRHEDPGEFSGALETLYRNHASRWAAKNQSGVFVSEKKRRFYSLLTQRLHDAGALRFYYLKLNGLIVAQEYCFKHGDTLYLLQEGFDFAFQKENVGNMLRAMIFEQIIAEGLKVYDFLAGMGRHKKTWSDHFPEDICFEVARNRLKARGLHAAPPLVDRLRATLKKILKRGQPEAA